MKNKRIKKRRIILRRLSAVLITALVTFGIVFSAVKICQLFFPNLADDGFVPAAFGRRIAKNVKVAQGLEIPEWIDSQIITVHSTARTGAHLKDINNIVIHYVGNPQTTAQNNRDYYNKPTTEVSSHFVVGLEGEIIQCIQLWEKSAASNDRNGDTISIEVCHPDKSGKFNDDTYNSLIKLSGWLCDEFGLDEEDIIRHYDITEKICPKYYVENPDKWKIFIKDVKKELEALENN